MKSDIARQPLVPAFLTLALVAGAAACFAPDAASSLVGELPGTADAAGRFTSSAGGAIARFQGAFPIWSRIAAGAAILFAGMSIGRLTVRYGLYSVGTCLAIPLFGAVACGGLGEDFLTASVAAALLALAVKNCARALRNGYGFDPIFRGGLYLGLLVLVYPAALPLAGLLPLAFALFRRTLREAVVGVFGLLLPGAVLCYLHWAGGGDFTEPLLRLIAVLRSGEPLQLFAGMPLASFLFPLSIAALDLVCILFFFSDFYAAGNKPRLILLFHIGVYLLALLTLCIPSATATGYVLLAVPSAVLLPLFFVRVHRALSLAAYLVLLAGALFSLLIK